MTMGIRPDEFLRISSTKNSSVVSLTVYTVSGSCFNLSVPIKTARHIVNNHRVGDRIHVEFYSDEFSYLRASGTNFDLKILEVDFTATEQQISTIVEMIRKEIRKLTFG